MANQKALIVENGVQAQINNADTLLVGAAIDKSTTGTLTIGGTTATAITIGSASITTAFPGPVTLTGDVTTVGGTTFTTDAVFEGNLTFGNAATDNISFVGQIDTGVTWEGIAAPSVSPAGTGRIYFDSTSNTFKASQNGGAYTDLISAGGGSTVDLTITTTGLTVGDVCYILSNNTASAANATAISTANALGIVQTVAGAGSGKVRTQGVITANFITGLTLSAGQTAYLSKTAGKLTNDVSAFTTGNVYVPVGIITNVTTAGGGTGAADVAVNLDLVIVV